MKTPKTLFEAIENAIQAGLDEGEWENDSGKRIEDVIHSHVVDFLRQRFGTAYLEHGNDTEIVSAIHDLFKAITSPEVKTPQAQTDFEEWHA